MMGTGDFVLGHNFVDRAIHMTHLLFSLYRLHLHWMYYRFKYLTFWVSGELAVLRVGAGRGGLVGVSDLTAV